ncbi:hypothetical protein BN59_02568 [Legionella massiliensis]|uniref:Toxin CptA n=1 Tax=Legionella massiliensis TaxID=1034943 RepID=A0A078L2L6_9GAMM|nr:protein YgfX [Legionella massiliensis]CDZ78258.1 hypothetical protein BN59_02568 [Legionella massiliensis]CEE13996.1 hypothetical protein BN1094_02568 [Legionella massiliensis]
MLNLLQQRIVLGKSRFYMKLSLLISASALILLYYSSCWLPLKILLGFILVFQLIRIYKNPIPYPEYSGISYGADGWTIHTQNEQELFYERGRVIIDTGLFILLELSLGQKRKRIVLFLDQISNDFYRSLKIKEKIQ